MNKTNYLVMLVGAPGSGKSTYIKNQMNIELDYLDLDNPVILSSDHYIQKYADDHGMTYNQAFSDYIKIAENNMQKDLTQAILDKKDIVWDQTNMSYKTRKNKLNKIPSNYIKIAVVFECDRETLIERNKNRVGKTIPTAIIDSMLSSYEPPLFDEGFNSIIHAYK